MLSAITCDAPSTPCAGRLQMTEKAPAGGGIGLLRFAPKEVLPIAQADCAEIADPAPCQMEKQDRILGFLPLQKS